MRLARMIALSSELSRRAAEEAIAQGSVTVNGEAISTPATTVDIHDDEVRLEGRRLHITSLATYIAYHKPRGLLVTKSDPHGGDLIWKDLARFRASCNAVGRLDRDSEGLLLVTDDGDFLHRLTHPRHEITKTYEVRVHGVPSAAALEQLRGGVLLDGRRTLPATITRLDRGEANARFRVRIREGRNRQIRRMFEEVGHRVSRLRRVAIGDLKLGRLKPGEWRFLKAFEVERLLREAGPGSRSDECVSSENRTGDSSLRSE